MQPDVAGLALATGVLAGVIGAFWLTSLVISGPVAGLTYTIGREVARGVAVWAASSRDAADSAGARREDEDAGSQGDNRDGGEGGLYVDVALDPAIPAPARVAGGRPHLRIHCRVAAAA